jgi:hypothetical protein
MTGEPKMEHEDNSASAGEETTEKCQRSMPSRRPRKSILSTRRGEEQDQEERERLAELEIELQERCSELGLQLIKSNDPRSVPLGLNEYFLRLSDGSEDVDVRLSVEKSVVLKRFIVDLSRELWLLSDCAGIVQVDRGYIEVIIENADGAKSWSTYYIDDRLFSHPETPEARRHTGRISAVADTADLAVEISQPSALFSVLESRISPPPGLLYGTFGDEPTTLKVSGITLRDRQHGEKVLRAIAQSLSFDLEARFGRGFSLYPRFDWNSLRNGKRADDRGSGTVNPVRQPLKLTLNAYAREATSYYWHARKVENVPLAAYLGYYQVLEYHFQRYLHQDLIKLVRRRLKDPGLDIDNDHDLGRLMSAVGGALSRRNSELQQLTVTLSNCLDPENLAQFIANDESLSAHLTRKDGIPGIPTVPSNLAESSLVERVAERIHKLRCRIVHSKGESRGGEKILLLVPDSHAALSVKEDIKLVRFAAQAVIIASSDTLDLDRL